MKITHSSKIQSLILAAALGTGLGFVSPVSAQTHSYIVDTNGKGLTDLGSLSGGGTEASAINDAGQVVGNSTTGDSHALMTGHAFITGPNGVGMTVLGTLGGDYSGARGINDAGQVVGFSSTAAGYQHAFITGPNGVGMTDLGPLSVITPGDSYTDSYASGINAAGQVVGWSPTAAGVTHAFITGPNGVGMTDLGTLGGGGGYSYANGINDAGQVVGYASTAAGAWHAFISGPNGVGMTDLGTLGGSYSVASGINDAGQVVGWSYTAAGAQHAFITGPNGVGMTDLNSLVSQPGGVVLSGAAGVNNHGQVVAIGIPPIPEPETYAMFMAGLGLMGFIARRSKTV